MKNKIKKIFMFMGIITITMGGYVYSKQPSAKTPSLLLKNIEALASSETSHVVCLGTGSVNCPLTHTKVYTYITPYSLR